MGLLFMQMRPLEPRKRSTPNPGMRRSTAYINRFRPKNLFMNEKSLDTIYRWLRQSKVNQMAHYESSKREERRHRLIGACTILFAMGSAFLMLYPYKFYVFEIFIPMMSIIVAILATMQTFMGFEGKALKHRLIAAEYSALNREIELFLAQEKDEEQDVLFFLKAINSKLEHLMQDAPEIPSMVFHRIDHKFRRSDFIDSYSSGEFDEILKDRS